MAVTELNHNDREIPIIPITPVEEEEEDLTTDSQLSHEDLQKARCGIVEPDLIDGDLLIQILSDPYLIEKLVADGNPSPPPLHMVVPPPPPPPPAASTAVVKDTNYYKSLIQQHGEEKQEMVATNGSSKSKEVKPKIQKACIYFNSSRGCKHGHNCSYLHVLLPRHRSSPIPDAQNPKRLKMEREITGS